METLARKKAILMQIAAMLIMGSIGLFRRYLPISSPLLAFCRGSIGAAVLLVFVLLKKQKPLRHFSGRKWLALAVNGAFLGINWILLFEAYNHTTIAAATLCYYMQPTIVLLLSPLLFGEKLTARKLLCATAAVLGMVLVSGIGGAITPQSTTGILLGLGAAVFYSLVVILNKKIGPMDSYDKTIVQLASAAVVLVPYLLFTEKPTDSAWNTGTVLLLLVVGVVHTGVAYLLYFGSMSGLKAQTISTLSYIDPVTALLVSLLLLREPIGLGGLFGAVLILASAFLSEWEPPHKSKQTKGTIQ